MKITNKNLCLFSILLACFVFAQCGDAKKTENAGESADLAENPGFADSKPKAYLVLVVGNPTEDPGCLASACNGLACGAVQQPTVGAIAGTMEYNLCTCILNCTEAATAATGKYLWNGNQAGNFSTGSIPVNGSAPLTLALNTGSLTQTGQSGILLYIDSTGDTLGNYTINF